MTMIELQLPNAAPNQIIKNHLSITEEIDKIFRKERTRQDSSLNMIASSNILPKYVREALGSDFTTVVAEGYRNNRYHTGTENYDDLEILGEELAQKAFGGYHVNLKPHSGTQAVQAAFLAMKAEGRNCVLSMGLQEGGHITHGKITHFNKAIGFKFVHYGLLPDGSIDYEQVEQLAKQEGADIIVVGASAYPKKIEWSCFREIADKVGARIIADISHYAGLIAGGAYPNPGANADIIVMSTNKTLPGPKGGIILFGKPDEKLKQKVNRAVNIGLQSEDISNGVVAKVAVLALAQHERFTEYAQATVANARLLCNYFQNSGIPVVGYDTKTQGTDSHIALINVHAYNPLLNGNIVAEALAKAGIYANRNPIPNETLSSNETSGVRFGTAAMSLLGMGTSEVTQVGAIIAEVIASLRVDEGKELSTNTILQTARLDIAKLRQKFSKTIFDR